MLLSVVDSCIMSRGQSHGIMLPIQMRNPRKNPDLKPDSCTHRRGRRQRAKSEMYFIDQIVLVHFYLINVPLFAPSQGIDRGKGVSPEFAHDDGRTVEPQFECSIYWQAGKNEFLLGTDRRTV